MNESYTNPLDFIQLPKQPFFSDLAFSTDPLATSKLNDEKDKIEQNLSQEISVDLKISLFQNNITIYHDLFLRFILSGDFEMAMENLVQSKSRSLAEIIKIKEYLEQTQSVYSNDLNFIKIIGDYLSLQISQIQAPKDNRNILIGQKLDEIKKYFDKEFPPKVELIKYKDVKDLSEKSGRAIVLFRVTDKGTFAFIVYPDGRVEKPPIQKEEFTNQRLREIIIKWLTPYFAYLNFRLMKDLDSFKESMLPTLKVIYTELMKDVHDKLKEKDVKDVLFVPNGDLAILPLHACCWNEDNQWKYLIDDELTISYATSIPVFKRALELNRQKQDNFLFITNPENSDPDRNLKYSDEEVDGIMQTFGVKEKDLRHNQAKKQTVKDEMKKGYSFYHFSCHGSSDRQNPFDSNLILADGEIRVKEVMETSLSDAWLTTLSACETSIVNFMEISDEHYGFPLAFIFAGCPSIWGTLWSVRDDATSALMKLAYQNIKEGKEKVKALQLAQIKLKENPQYESPYYWAGFQHFGV